MNLIALAATLRSFSITWRLCHPGRPPSSWCRSYQYLQHCSRIYNTVCYPSWHGQLALVMPGTLWLKRKSWSPIFSVRIWTRNALCCLLSPLCA
ncbi:hypothetical protein LY78DRAFT_726596 [Colletotrichum sublineola]|nr:hypothetical protein LY78DRAFT_726596 [Colletotrichum sublineola]